MYREVAPPPALARHLACLWVATIGPDAVAVLPDACADIIAVGEAPPMVVGPSTRTEHPALAPGTVVVGARFRPGRIAAGLGVPADRLLDRAVPLAALWGDAAIAPWQRVAGASIPTRLAALGDALTARLSAPAPIDALVTEAVSWMARHPDAHLDALVAHLGVSSRHLQRRVRAASGYGPKLLQRILRFQRLVVAMADRSASLASLAATAGFVDQPHMTREVRALAEVTPRALRAQHAPVDAMAEFFKTVGGGVAMVGR